MLTLETDRFRLVLAPEIGGSVARFDLRDGDRSVPLLRGSDAPTRVLDAGCFPLVPFCNRIRDGRFTFDGRTVELTPNMAGDPSPLHGQGWLSVWTVAEHGSAVAELIFAHRPGEWPWRYSAKQRFSLTDTGLEAELTCTNEDSRPMPCGLGFHPYFPCNQATHLATHVEHVWTVDEHVLPIERQRATGRFDVSGGPVCGRDLDNGYDGWRGEAWIDGVPGTPLRLRMASNTARFFQLYSPASGGLFVAEPVTHANAALNEPADRWPELGIRVLEPGATMRLDMSLTVT
jgi:aldose 1-epimerase